MRRRTYEACQCGAPVQPASSSCCVVVLPEVEDTPPSVRGEFGCGCFLRWDAELKLLTASLDGGGVDGVIRPPRPAVDCRFGYGTRQRRREREVEWRARVAARATASQ